MKWRMIGYEIRELNPDYDISMHKLNVCVGDSQYRLVYCIYVEHKESGISVYRDKDFDVQEVIRYNTHTNELSS